MFGSFASYVRQHHVGVLAPLIALLLLLVVAGAVANSAGAATVRLDHGVLSYSADPGERNSPYVWVRRSSGEVGIEVSDVQRARGGCALVGRSRARCPLVAGAPLPGIRIVLGDRADSAEVERLTGRVAGGPGNDALTAAGLLDGGPGNDHLTLTRGQARKARGGLGDDQLEVAGEVTSGAVLEGGRGDDRLNGGSGDDVVRGGLGDDLVGDVGDEGADVYRLGPGSDRAFSRGADTIFARDGTYDNIECGGRETVILDGLDFYDQELARCRRVRRRGLARSLPDGGVAYLEEDHEEGAGPNDLEVYFTCPYDGPATCSGMLTVSDRRQTVLHAPFSWSSRGLNYEVFHLPRRTLRRLAKWARITVVSYDRLGGLHRHAIAGPDVVVINNPEYCC